MAWNQPGNNGGKDPWGNRGQQGPPDLDELFRKLQEGLGNLLGGGRGDGGGKGNNEGGDDDPEKSSAGKVGLMGLSILLVAVLLVWGIAGFYIVQPEEEAVVLRFGAYSQTTEPGLNWRPLFIDTVEKVNVTGVRSVPIGYRDQGEGGVSVPHESLMLTKDENIIDIKFEVQYRVHDPRSFLFNIVEPENTLRQATESAVREIVGKRKMDPIISKERDLVAEQAQLLIQEILDRYGEGGAGIKVTSVNMQDAQAPKEVQAAYADAVRAREDEERFKNEAKAYAADIIPKARGEANAIRERSHAYRQRVVAAAEGETDRFLKVLNEYEKAPDITRARLYLEAVESVMENTSKVLIDVKDGNSLMYLPLDKLLMPRTDDLPEDTDANGKEKDQSAQSSPRAMERERSTDRGRNR
uniref:Protein HflK n=1 Tax=Candidatus Kentrum sp. SD TaxID=2126332 RepID=A0A450YPI0_9GAMM|nr:MAG: membrane protease subunit HflK [Candidatus Kentron sp. SD]VFK43425.1 MAG: membrane protease subunit HflK [Candidatus Kentron sp. SD]VFK78845.1 MAG: membrane protease subunit HflK [Candidatus Kentron sp. SD]